MLDDLSRAREGFVLASDLHLVYLVTPINVDVEPDWELYYERFMELSALDQVICLLANKQLIANDFVPVHVIYIFFICYWRTNKFIGDITENLMFKV